jgi:hyperosmotically inducible periplasmic protein
MRSSRAFVIGVGAAYFLDPRLGRRRRNVARDRAAKAVRKVTRNTGKKARFSAGKARGLYARSRQVVLHPAVDGDDAVVEQRIRSEALRDVGIPTSDIDLTVEDGVVTLIGSVFGDKPASDLVARVQKVPGVVDVAAMLRVVNDGGD